MSGKSQRAESHRGFAGSLSSADLRKQVINLKFELRCLDERIHRKRAKATGDKRVDPAPKNKQTVLPKKAKAQTGFLYRRRRTLALDGNQQIVKKAERHQEIKAERRKKLRRILVNNAFAQGGIDKLYKKLDKDQSGGITLKEWTTGLERLALSRGNGAMSARTRNNMNGMTLLAQDGSLSELHRELDTNHDGVIDLEELTAFVTKANEMVGMTPRGTHMQGEFSPRVKGMSLRGAGWVTSRADAVVRKQEGLWPEEAWVPQREPGRGF